MRYEAVIFDLFGTLVDNISVKYTALLRREEALARLAPGCEDAFARIWAGRDARRLQTLGILSTEALIRHTCDELGLKPDQSDIDWAVELRMQRFSDALIPRHGAVEALAALKRAGYRLGLISDCSPEVAALWPRSKAAGLFDEMMFSCQIGLAKPEPRLYELTAERLGTTTDRCFYIGDGAHKELTGARQAGMDAALLWADVPDGPAAPRTEAATWDGLRIKAITEIPALLTSREAAHAAARAARVTSRLGDRVVRL